MSRKSSRKKTSKRNTKKHSAHSKQNRFLAVLISPFTLGGLLFFLLMFSGYLLYLDQQIVDKMSGRIWSLPSHIYSRPLELYEDKIISPADLQDELRSIGYQQVSARPTRAGQFRVLNAQQFELISRDFVFWDGLQKSRGLRLRIEHNRIQQLAELNAAQPVSLFRLEPQRIAGIYPQQKEERQVIQLEQVPDNLVLALLSVEDRRFYQHWGIDLRSIARAMVANITAGKTVQGASTLTQQLVKNLFLTPERSFLRKINEALMAALMEMRYDKSDILEAYINEIYLGQSGSRQIHGFELASQFYFSQSLSDIRLDQVALLVGLVKGPSWYEPRKHPERATARRNQVLELMHEQQVITTDQLNKYKSMPLGLSAKPSFTSNRFPALVDLVKRQLRQDYNDDDLKSTGLKIFTSIDPLIQKKAEATVRRVLPQLERNRNPAAPLQASIIVASSQQGEIQAMVSDRNPDYPGFNRSLDAVRQIGSLIKPAIYLSALQQPQRYTLASLLDDSPLHIKTSKDQTWSPQNYDKQFEGDIPLFHALRHSRNVPTVRLGLELGLAAISDSLHNLGVRRDIPRYPSMTLGAFNLAPIDVANMYQTFAANGFHVPLKVIREVLNNNDQPLKRYPLESTKTLDERPVFLANYALHMVTTTGTAKSLQQQFDVKLAGKTGTTDDLRDSWFAGFSDNQLAVAWVGRDDNSSTMLTGSSGALRLWTDLMRQLPLNDISLQPPAGVEMHWIDEETGGLSDKSCQGAVELPFISGSAPTEKVECKGGLLYQLKRLFN